MLPSSPNGAGLVNSFALVTYIPPPLGSFLDDLRCQLEPAGAPSRAHVTLLPPRPLRIDVEAAWEQIRQTGRSFTTFPIEAGEITLFQETSVIYLSVGDGGDRLRQAHRLLNVEGLEQAEAYAYCPHITLAQTLRPGQIPDLMEVARRRWLAWAGPRRFLARAFTFVQNTTENRWQDLRQFTAADQP